MTRRTLQTALQFAAAWTWTYGLLRYGLAWLFL
jgi:hypothetical protein